MPEEEMDWMYVAPAIGAGLVSAAAFWWVALRWLCRTCDAGVCTWEAGCAGWLGGLLAVVLVGVAVAIPCRLVEGCWPWRRR